MGLKEDKRNIEVLRSFLVKLRERKSSPLYDRTQCEEMILAIEASIVALECQVYA